MTARIARGLVFLLLTAILVLPVDAALKDSVISAWLFDEGTGLAASDSFANHDGSIVGNAAWSDGGKFGKAIEFSGEPGDRVEIPDDAELSLETWTITAWVKLQPSLVNDWAIIVVKDPANGLQNYSLDLTPQGSVVAEVTNGGTWSDCVSITSVYDDEWHFAAASYDGELLRAYVDGELEAEQEFGPGDISDAPVSIGGRLNDSQPLFGIVDDVGLFDTALTDQDLATVMNQGLKAALSLGSVAGDFNGNGLLDAADIDALHARIAAGDNNSTYDLNADGLVNSIDRRVWLVDLKKTYVGDANLDGVFSSADFVAVFQAGQYEDAVPKNSGWSTGDWDGDQEFGSADFVAAFQDGGFEIGPRAAVSAVPEPSTTASLVIIVIASLSWRRPGCAR
jgi:hypothetical protein